jgi:hypothetical protein
MHADEAPNVEINANADQRFNVAIIHRGMLLKVLIKLLLKTKLT